MSPDPLTTEIRIFYLRAQPEENCGRREAIKLSPTELFLYLHNYDQN